jgi:hypothetical protein
MYLCFDFNLLIFFIFFSHPFLVLSTTFIILLVRHTMQTKYLLKCLIDNKYEIYLCTMPNSQLTNFAIIFAQ